MQPLLQRVLDAESVADLGHHRARGGGAAWAAAEQLGPVAVVDLLEAADLRGRGGAGFPTAVKWATVARHTTATGRAATVVVNAAEGEPGSFKDRTLIRRNPYKVLEGALVAASVLGAGRVVVAIKGSFGEERVRLDAAAREFAADADFAEAPPVEIVAGPDAYLFGEETAMLEVIAGRAPFPRVSPPWRRGVDDVDTPSTADTTLASPSATDDVAPTLVNNVETLAHVSDILTHGADWFRSGGVSGHSGTMLVTVTGDTFRHGVVEVPLGSTMRDILELGGGGVRFEPLGVLSGVSHPIVPASHLDRPVGHGDGAIHAGAGAYRAFDTRTDPVAIAAGVARFLAVESCGQCTPCKVDGLELRGALADLAANRAADDGLARIAELAEGITEGARCALAAQQQDIVTGLFAEFEAIPAAHLARAVSAVDPVLIAPLRGIEGDVAVYDATHRERQPDWSHDETWDGSFPAETVTAGAGR